jgi:vitamin B12 transporter
MQMAIFDTVARGAATHRGSIMIVPTTLLVLLFAEAAATTAPIEEVTIIATRTPTPLGEAPAPVEIIERAALDARQSGEPADMLRGAAGFAVSQSGGNGSLTEVRLRGAESNHLLVSIDGIAVNDPALGSNVDFANMDLIGATRIEILPGAQTALWGSDALAGIINVETTPSAGVVRRDVGVEAGSNDTLRESIELADGRGEWRYALSARHTETDGTNIASVGGEDDGYHNTTVHLNTGYVGERGSVRFVAHAVDAQSQYDPTPFPAFVPVDGNLELKVQQRMGGISGNYLISPNWDQHISVTRYEATNDNFEDGARTNSSNGDKTQFGYQSDFLFNLLDARQRLTLAYEYDVEGFGQQGAVSPFGNPNQNQHYDTNSAIVEYASEWDWANATLSVRRDDNSDFADANSYRAAVRVPIANYGTTLFVTAGTGRKDPTFTERFGFTPDTFFGNPALRPEESQSLSVAVEQNFYDTAHLRVSLFRDGLRDEIDGFVFDAALGGFTAANSNGHSHREGVEFVLQAQPIAKTNVQLDFTYLHATQPGDPQDELRRPRYSGRFTVDYTTLADRLALQFGVAYVGTHDDSDFGTFPARLVKLDPYTLLHCTARYTLNERFMITGRVENMTDEHYQDVFGYMTPGRSAYLGLMMTL